MTNNEKVINRERIAILVLNLKKETGITRDGWNGYYKPDNSRILYFDLPDYCNDLNAMQDAWKWLCTETDDVDSLEWESFRTRYGEELEAIAMTKIKKSGGSLSYVLSNLSAEEKAQAFIRFMDKEEL